MNSPEFLSLSGRVAAPLRIRWILPLFSEATLMYRVHFKFGQSKQVNISLRFSLYSI